MASKKYAYRDIAQPLFQETLKGHNTNTLRLVKTVAEFAQKVSLAHEQFASQVQSLAEAYVKKNQELKKESKIYDGDWNLYSRPVECHSTLCAAWESLLQETQYDAQAHADIASLLIKSVCNPLLEIGSYKRSQAKRLYSFRENFEAMLQCADENVQKSHKAYIKAYQTYRSNMNTREAMKHMAAYHNAHNEYILQLQSSNMQEEEYHQMALPYLLEELEEIHIDLSNTLNGGIESHALLLLTKANEQGKRFEGILKICKQVNPKNDVHNFLLTIIREPSPCEPREYSFSPPCDPNIPGSELTTLTNNIVRDRHTDAMLNSLRQNLQREATELVSYLKQSQAVMQTLTTVCQRNLANHLHAKVYETQEDLCRKRNEIRLASLQLAVIRSQIELLSPRQNGTAVEVNREGPGKSNRASIIRGMWKKAFKGLKPPNKDKDKDKDKGDKANKQEKDTGNDREKDEKIKSDTAAERKLTKQASRSSLKKMMKRKDSKESRENVPDEPDIDDCKYSDIDPVYSLLKCAADLPRSGKFGSGHGCCSQKGNNDNVTLLSNSRSSSPSSAKLKSKSLLKLRETTPSPSGSMLSMAKYRRVRFKQENKKSQSLETPYHHSHQQQKLRVDMEGDLQERSFSATSIPQCGRDKGIQRMASLAPPRHPPIHYQRSISLDEISMSSASEHEKWEKEAIAEHNSSWSRQSSKQQGLLDLRRAAFRQQRSYSHNDISPCTEHEKWEKEGVVDNVVPNLRNQPPSPSPAAVTITTATPARGKSEAEVLGSAVTAQDDIPVPSSPVPQDNNVQQESPAPQTSPKDKDNKDTPSTPAQQHPAQTRSPLPNNASETLREDSFDPCTWSPIEDCSADESNKKRTSTAKSRLPRRIPKKQSTRQDSGSSSGSGTPAKGKVTKGKTPPPGSSNKKMTSRENWVGSSGGGSSARSSKTSRDSMHHQDQGPTRGSSHSSIDRGAHSASPRNTRDPRMVAHGGSPRTVARRTSKENVVSGAGRLDRRVSKEAVAPGAPQSRSPRRSSRDAASVESAYTKSERRQSREYSHGVDPRAVPRHSVSSSPRRVSDSPRSERQGHGHRSEGHGYRSEGRHHDEGYHRTRTEQRHGSMPTVSSGRRQSTTDYKEVAGAGQQAGSRSKGEQRRSSRDVAPEPRPSAICADSSVSQRPQADRPQTLNRRDANEDETTGQASSPRVRKWNREMTMAPSSAPIPRQPHRRSLPVITTEMYQSIDKPDSTSEATGTGKTTAANRSPRNKTLLLLHERKSRSFDSTFDERHQGQGYASHAETFEIDVESQEEFRRTYQEKLHHISRWEEQNAEVVDAYSSRRVSPHRREYDAYHEPKLETDTSPRRDKSLSPRRDPEYLGSERSPREELREYFERGRAFRQDPTTYQDKRKDISPKRVEKEADDAQYKSRQRSPRRESEDSRGYSDRGQGHSDRGQGHSDRGQGHSDRGQGHSGQGHSDRVQGHSDRGQGHSDRGQGHSGQGHSDRVQGHSERVQSHSQGHSDRGQGERSQSRRHLSSTSPRRGEHQTSSKYPTDQTDSYQRPEKDYRSPRPDKSEQFQSSDHHVDYSKQRESDSGYNTSRATDPLKDKRKRFPQLGQSETSYYPLEFQELEMGIPLRQYDGTRGSNSSTKRHLLVLMHKKKSQSFDGPYEYVSGEIEPVSQSDRATMRRKQCFQQQKSYSVDSPYDMELPDGEHTHELIKTGTRTGEIVHQPTILEPITLTGLQNQEDEDGDIIVEGNPNYLGFLDKKSGKFVHQKSHSVDVAEAELPPDDGKQLLEAKPLVQSFPSDSKSNDLSNIRKKSIGDLMNELQKLKDERKKALHQAMSKFNSNMARRESLAGQESKDSINSRRTQFQQQRSYSLDTPQSTHYKNIAEIPPQPQQAVSSKQPKETGTSNSSAASSSSKTTGKPTASVKAKRMSQFQQQKSYSLDMIEEHSYRLQEGTGSGQPQQQRRRVVSDSSDRPPSQDTAGGGGGSGSNRQKMMQLRAMKLVPDPDHDQFPATPPEACPRPGRLHPSQAEYGVGQRDYAMYGNARDYSPHRGSGYEEGVFDNEHLDPGRDRPRHLSPGKHRDQSLSPHRDSGSSSGRRHVSPSSRDGGSKHTSPARNQEARASRDSSHHSPGRPHGSSPGGFERRDFISPGWEGDHTDAPQLEGGRDPRLQQVTLLSRSDLIQAIKERLDLSPFLDPSKLDLTTAPQSPPRTTRKKLNSRMKSFSLDMPDPPRPLAVIDESSKKKSSSLVASSACFGATSPGQIHLRSRYWGRSSSFDIEDSYESQSPHSAASLSPRSGNSRSNSRNNSPNIQRRSISANVFAVLYNFKGKEKGDLDLRCGWKVHAIDTSNADWWKGKCSGRIGYFPANYVTRITRGERVMQVTHGFEVSGQEQDGRTIRLLKDQIVIQEGEEDGGMAMIRTASDIHFPCPLKYLTEVGSS